MIRAVSRQTAILVYKQTILPVLEYCGYLYNGVLVAQHRRLQLTQNRCLRTCLNVKIKLDGDVSADGDEISAKAKVDLPWLCGRDPVLSGTLYKA